MTGSLLIRDAAILTLDAQDRFIARGDILIEHGVIVAVGVVAPGRAAQASRIVEGRNRLVAPGLINAHMHSQSATMAGFADRLSHPAFMWLTQAHTSRRTPDEIRLSVLLSAIQMLTTGTTAAIDHFPGQRFSRADIDAAMAAWDETGMRILLGLRFFDGDFGDIIPHGVELPEALAAEARRIEVLKPHPLDDLRALMPEIVRDWHRRSPLLAVAPAPSNPDRCSDEALVFCAELAERHDLAIHTHLLETKTQARMAQERYGATTVAHLEHLGVLSERWSCAHCNWLTDDDIALMARHGVIAVHNPESNARIGAGRMRTPEMLAAGVPLALGTDGAGANDNLGLHEAMRCAAFLHRAELPERRRWVSARDALRMATTGGARAMRLGRRVGAIAPGQGADLALYRLDSPSWTPLNDPVAQLVFAESGSSVDCVMVAGRILLEDGRVTAFDAPAALAEIDGMVASLRRRNADLFRVAAAIAERVP